MAPEVEPYIGPRPFKREDAKFFFGRDREANELRALIISHSEVLLYAQSGAGKTSLMNAKLRPLLEDDDLEVLPSTSVKGPQPANKGTNVYVYNTLVRWNQHQRRTKTTSGAEPAPSMSHPIDMLPTMTLREFLENRDPLLDEEGLPKLFVAIFDQFEELFTSYPECWQQRREFFEQVRDALNTLPEMRALFAMREDYIAAMDQYAAIMPEKFRVRFHLENLRELQAIEAIEGPLTWDQNRHFAEGVAEKLATELMTLQVQTASGPEPIVGEFVQPVQLQVVCQRLWRDLKPEDAEITFAHLETISVEKALLSFYEDSIREVARDTGIDEARLRAWFEQKLVTPAGTRGMVFRGETETAGMRNDAVDAFDARHIIRSEPRDGRPWYELTHDRFVDAIQASYQRMLLSLEAGAEKTRTQLEAKATGWVSLGLRKSELLRGDELHKAEGWLNGSAAKALGSSDALRELVKASKAEDQARARRLKVWSIGAALLIIFPLAAAAVYFSVEARRLRAVADEAKMGNLTTADLPQITADIFKPMDGGIDLSPEEIMGRNTWNLWSAGNEHFWNHAAQDSFGLMDLLKMLDNRKFPRGERFKVLGLVNEPGFRAASKPDEFGLWLDEEAEPEPPGIDRTVYGKSSGVLGFRLFPNPDFNEEARKKWNGDRFMNDSSYYNDNKLIRPYRVGVACGSCHIAPNPSNPPLDPENPRWENLASVIGNQYIREGKVFACNAEKGGFFYEMLAAQPPGTSDISRIATDNINNPSAINPILLVGERARIASRERMAGGTLALIGVTEEMLVPRILNDSADSIGFQGSVLRFYVNMGMFSEYWRKLHNNLIGLVPQRPFEISYAREQSVYWRATEERLPNIMAFFRRPHTFHLADAPGGQGYITADAAVMTRGKEVFAESCARCHSSKQPPFNIDANSSEGKAWFQTAVMTPDFLESNFLSNDKRYPLTKIETNSANAFATNAKSGHVWDNFSSLTYKELPPVDELEFFNPFDETHPIKFKPKEKNVGPGYYRVPSLVSVWSSAPLLHNNTLGKFTGDPSVAGRMDAFNDAIEKLLWPEKRLNKDSIWRTQNECDLYLRKEFLPKPLQALANNNSYVKLGPIPKGIPINLFANLEPDFEQAVALSAKIAKALPEIHTMNLSSEQATAELIKAVPELLAANKCPDFIEDKGHYFGTDLPDADKRALIEYMKIF